MVDEVQEPGRLGYGTTVRVGRGSPVVWTELELVGDITMPEDDVDEIDVTHMKSPGGRKQYIPGLIDSGECTVPVNYVPGNATDVLVQDMRTKRDMVLIEFTLPKAPGAEATVVAMKERYAGYVSGYSRDVPVQDKMAAEVTFRLNERVAI